MVPRINVKYSTYEYTCIKYYEFITDGENSLNLSFIFNTDIFSTRIFFKIEHWVQALLRRYLIIQM